MFQLDEASQSFDRKFRNINGQYYFTLKGADWMLPVSEDEYFNARDLSAVIAKVAFVLTWAVNIAAVGYSAYLYMFLDRPLIQAVGVWIASFVVCFFINLYPQTIPTMSMWQRLKQAQQLDDASKRQVLVRRTELI
jgi:hypothetical protein